MAIRPGDFVIQRHRKGPLRVFQVKALEGYLLTLKSLSQGTTSTSSLDEVTKVGSEEAAGLFRKELRQILRKGFGKQKSASTDAI